MRAISCKTNGTGLWYNRTCRSAVFTGKSLHTQEWSQIWHNAQLDVELLQASYVRHAYPRHFHEYYVICVIERGFQSFTHQDAKHFTPPGGVILVNPGAVHTGEAADEQGFQMRSLYPTLSHMETAVFELTGRHQELPFFKEVRVDHRWARNSILALHNALAQGAYSLEFESRFAWTSRNSSSAMLICALAKNLWAGSRKPSSEPAAISRKTLRTVSA